MSDFSLPDPAKYNSLQSEALFRDTFAVIKQYLNDPNTEIHLDNASDETRAKIEDLLEVVKRKARSVRTEAVR